MTARTIRPRASLGEIGADPVNVVDVASPNRRASLIRQKEISYINASCAVVRSIVVKLFIASRIKRRDWRADLAMAV